MKLAYVLCVTLLFIANNIKPSIGFQEDIGEFHMIVSDFTGSEGRAMTTVNDPVMGGSSHSTASNNPGCCLVWEGEVKDVWFLRAPGFCILETADIQSFEGLGGTMGIAFEVNMGSSSEMLLPMAAQITTGATTKSGKDITYSATLSKRFTESGGVELYAPWTSFKGTYRGKEIHAPPLDSQELEKTYRIGLSTYASHKKGKFHVEVTRLIAPINSNASMVS